MPPIGAAAVDASRRVAGAILPRFDFTKPVLDALGPRVERTIAPSSTAFRGVLELVKNRLDALTVMDGNQLAGIVTERDFLRLPLERGIVRRTRVSGETLLDLSRPPPGPARA